MGNGDDVLDFAPGMSVEYNGGNGNDIIRNVADKAAQEEWRDVARENGEDTDDSANIDVYLGRGDD